MSELLSGENILSLNLSQANEAKVSTKYWRHKETHLKIGQKIIFT